MKFSLSNWEIKKIIQEIGYLKSSHLSQIYLNDNSFRMRLTSLKDSLPLPIRGEGTGRYSRVDLLFQLSGALFLLHSSLSPAAETAPPQFVMALRKTLSNAIVKGLDQVNGDRIVSIKLGKGEGIWEIIVELFSRGNILLVQEGKIERVFRREKFSYRIIAPGTQYKPPPNPYPLDKLIGKGIDDNIEECFTKKENVPAAVTLIHELSLPPHISREILYRAGLNIKIRGKDARERWYDIKKGIGEVVKEFLQSPKCYIYHPKKEEIILSGVELTHLETPEVKEYSSFVEALLYVYNSIPNRVEVVRDVENKTKENKLLRRLKLQEKAKEDLKLKAKVSQELAEAVYRHWDEIDNLLKGYRESRGDLRDFLKNEGERIKIKDPSKKIVLLKVMDEKLNEIQLEIPLNGDVNSVAKRYYEGMKSAKKKLEGVQKAIKSTEGLIKKGEDERGKREPRTRIKKRFWFDPYRWFITSTGKFVVAGRDAKSNERVVKKYLGDKDIYFHADISGASSVVLKTEGEQIKEEDIREAALFSVIHSKAWRSGVGYSRAYWVYPYQVSKTPQSGEFLPRGSFMIRGKKNFVDNLKIQCAAGEVEIQGDKRFMCGPEAAFKSHSKWYVILQPGNIFRKRILKAFHVLTGLPQEMIEAQLPGGNFKIVKIVGMKGEDEKVFMRELKDKKLREN